MNSKAWLAAQPPLQAMYDAYVAASGIPVTPTYLRLAALRDIHSRGLTAADMTAVISRIKTHVERGEKGWTEASLDWRNAVAVVDTFEERALKIRQEKTRKAARQAMPPAAAPASMTSQADQDRIIAAAKEQAAALRRSLEGGV